jgi:acid phosphatase (class A)
MKRMRLHAAVLSVVLFATWSLAAADAIYVTREQVDLTKILAPPPVLQSEEQKRDLGDLLAVQRSRTAQQAQRALADATAGTFGFADVLGPNFTAERLPKFAALIERVRGDGAVAFAAGKDAWNRPRPFQTSSEVNALGELPKSSSYPSGGSTNGYLTAIILANMVPEKSAALFARGREFGDNRVVLGVHYPRDVEAGRFAAIAIATGLLQSPTFLKDFAEAKAELRAVLGL